MGPSLGVSWKLPSISITQGNIWNVLVCIKCPSIISQKQNVSNIWKRKVLLFHRRSFNTDCNAKKYQNMIRNCLIFSMYHWWPSAGLSVCSFFFVVVCSHFCLRECMQSRYDFKRICDKEAPFDDYKVVVQQASPTGRLSPSSTQLFGCKRMTHVDFVSLKTRALPLIFLFLKVIWTNLLLKRLMWDRLQHKIHSNQPNGE